MRKWVPLAPIGFVAIAQTPSLEGCASVGLGPIPVGPQGARTGDTGQGHYQRPQRTTPKASHSLRVLKCSGFSGQY